MNEDEQLIEVAIPRPLTGLFTYKISKEFAHQIKKGSFVIVPFGKSKQIHAYVVHDPQKKVELPTGVTLSSLKSVMSVGDLELSLPEDLLELCHFAKNYYAAPFGEVLNAAAPAVALGLKNKAPKKEYKILTNSEKKTELNEEQKASLSFLEEKWWETQKNSFSKTVLLKGVTGSGKTEVYIELAKKVLAQKKSVLFLVPEISLTPQLHQRVQDGLGVTVALWHSSVSAQKRRDQWLDIRQGKIRVTLGARSSVFSPLQDLGVIIVDEEHDSSYKQEEKFRYHARDLAIFRAKINKTLCVLGSATPCFETLYHVSQKKYEFTELKKKFYSGLSTTSLELVHLGDEPRVEGIQTLLAEKTLLAIREEINKGQQVIIFLNRRGFAHFLLCQDCGHVMGCPHCAISLSVHKKKNQLLCHYCGYAEPIRLNCEKCDKTNLLLLGSGTEALEDDFKTLIPEAKIARLDRDVVTSHTRLEKIIQDFQAGKTNLLLGTQMLVKGHDFPGVSLVVVVLADSVLKWPDFRAFERGFQVLTQVSGRAGRGKLQGKVMIQTFMEDNPVLDVLSQKKTEEDFIQEELSLREALQYPPFSRMVKIRFEGKTSDEAFKKALFYKGFLDSNKIEILGPSEAFLSKLKGLYRVDLILKGKDIRVLHGELGRLVKQWSQKESRSLWVDVDPQQF